MQLLLGLLPSPQRISWGAPLRPFITRFACVNSSVGLAYVWVRVPCYPHHNVRGAPACRLALQQEQKYRRQNRLDGLPPWKPADEEALANLSNAQQQGLCWALVKSS